MSVKAQEVGHPRGAPEKQPSDEDSKRSITGHVEAEIEDQVGVDAGGHRIGRKREGVEGRIDTADQHARRHRSRADGLREANLATIRGGHFLQSVRTKLARSPLRL
jgi:hypothetical protein